MNASERKIFWDKLCAFDGTDIVAEGKALEKVIKLPHLYRYSTVSDSTSIG